MDYHCHRLSFPNELINEIIQYLPYGSQVACLGVSRAFRAVSAAFVFKNPIFSTIASVRKFSDILSCNEIASRAVRTVCFDIKTSRRSVYGNEYFVHSLDSYNEEVQPSSSEIRPLRNMLRNISHQVLELKILSLPHVLVKSFLPIRFPKLRSYISALYVEPETISFIKYHPHIQELRLFGYLRHNLREKKPRSPIQLPNLRVFSASEDCVPYFSPGQELTHIAWAENTFNEEKPGRVAMEAIKNAGAKIESVTFNITTISKWIFDRIPHYFPEARHICFSGLDLHGMEITGNKLCDAIENILPEMKKLEKLEIEWGRPLDYTTNTYGYRESDIGKELERLRGWSKLNGSLRQVLMPLTSTLWTRAEEGSDLWLPTCDTPTHMKWLSRRDRLVKSLFARIDKRSTFKEAKEALLQIKIALDSNLEDVEVEEKKDKYSDGTKVMMGSLLDLDKRWSGSFGVMQLPLLDGEDMLPKLVDDWYVYI